MRNIAIATVLVAALPFTTQAFAGEAFVNGQVARIALDNSALHSDSSNQLQVGAGYRWGIGPLKAGIEAGAGRIGEIDGQHSDGGVRHSFNASANHFSIGANARIKPPLMPVQFIGRAGYIGMRTTLEQSTTNPVSVTVHDRSTHNTDGSYVGAGIGTTLLPLLDVTLMVNQYRFGQVQYDAVAGRYRVSDDKRSARSVGVSVEYRF